MSATEFQLGQVDAADFARSVAETPLHELAEGMNGELRGQVLDEIFSRMEHHFDPKKSADVDLVINFTITGKPDSDPDRYQVVIRNDVCKTGKELTEEAALGLTLDAVDFLRLVANLTNGMNLYIGGKLKIDGSMIVATRIAGLFAIPDGSNADSPTTTPTQGV